MIRSTKVVDASALAAILFGEPKGPTVAGWIERDELMAPTLLRYELASVSLKKLRRYPERRHELVQALALFEELELKEVEVPPVAATQLAERTGLTAYDAAYLWLSRRLGIELVTLDEHLDAATRS